jgi:hypothetical protein
MGRPVQEVDDPLQSLVGRDGCLGARTRWSSQMLALQV